MAAKTTTKSNPTFAAALARVQPALRAWRQRRKHREPIPEHLWRAMVRMARRYGLSPVAQALRVNYTALKHHLVATATRQTSRSGGLAPEFVEVPMPACPTGPPRILDLSSQFSALNHVREIWNTAIQNTSTPPTARYSSRKMNPLPCLEGSPGARLSVVISLSFRVLRVFRGFNCCFSGHWSFLVESHSPQPFALIPP